MTTESAQTMDITQTYDLPHAPARVWRALTESDLLTRWNMANDFQPVVGRPFTFRTEPSPWWDGIVTGEVLVSEECKTLSYTWVGGPLDTVVTWTLEPTPSGGTLLTLEHTGFKAGEDRAQKGAAQGWRAKVEEGLRQLLATS